MKRLFRVFPAMLVLLCLSCSGPVMETKLNGFDQGKRTLKFNYILHPAKTESGEDGYRLETLVHHAIGTKTNHKTERESFLKSDFSLIKTQASVWENKTNKRMTAEVKGAKIHVTRETSGKPAEISEVDHLGPVFIEIHPLQYFNDLKKIGDSKTYPILLTEKSEVASVEVRYEGDVQFYEKNKAHQSRHYKIQAITSPEEYDDYYLDPETGNILKIEFGYLKFVPADD